MPALKPLIPKGPSRMEPIPRKNAQERAEITFANLEKEYLERHAKQRKLSWRDDEALLKNHLPKG